jgi:PAS domain S-box-containing protein
MHAFYNEEMKKAGLPEVYYKMASVNPRNPVNAADEFEASLISFFNKNREVHEFRKVINVDGKKYLYYAIPFLETNYNCIRCHGKRADAPPGLQAIYSGEGGFNETPGGYRAIESIRMPINDAFSNALIMACSLSIGTVAMLLLFFFNKRLKIMVGDKTASLESEIIEHKQAEARLKKSENLINQLLQNTDQGIYGIDIEANCTFINKSALKMIGYELADCLGKEMHDLIHHHYSNGLPYPVVDCPIYRAKLTGNGCREDSEVLWRKDGTFFNAEYSSYPIIENGNISGAVVTFSDISERKRTEEEKAKLEGQLLQSQKMEAVGRLAGGVAHDFNNMLGVITGYAELALMKLDPSQPIYANLIEIRTAAARSADLTRQLLAFARKQTIAPKIIDLNETVSGMLKMLQRLIGEDTNLNWHPASNLWPVKVDPSQIDQILANLCVNARDAITDVGRIIIETGNSSFDADYFGTYTYVEPGEYVRLAVSDNGCGMDNETQAHIFEPFFTTKGVGEGTGLGLAMVYGIVKQNHGFINVYSEPGQGTTFMIYLPRHTGESEEVLNESLPEPAPRGDETVLLVEDEPTILGMAALMLEGQGYTVLTAGSAAEATRLFREHNGTIHLLMTDVVMPDMNGRDLAKELQSLDYHLNCLFMSGYTANVIAHHGVLDEGVHFIQKPFSLSTLAVKVREVLDIQ